MQTTQKMRADIAFIYILTHEKSNYKWQKPEFVTREITGKSNGNKKCLLHPEQTVEKYRKVHRRSKTVFYHLCP